MAGITPNEGRVFAAEQVYAGNTLEMLLYAGPSSLTAGMVLADLTEVSGFGYARKTLAAGTWSITSSGVVTYPQQTFTPNGGSWSGANAPRGYAIVTTEATPRILHIEEGPNAPYDVADGQPYNVNPSSTVDD